MKTLVIKLDTINDVKNFVNIVSKYDFDMDLMSGRYAVDAKSIMGIFSLDLSKPIELNIHSEDEAEFEFRLQAVRQMVETLPESCRKIFVMAVVEGWGYAATASELGLSVNTVKSQVKIAYRKLKSNLREHPGGACLALLMWLCERG